MSTQNAEANPVYTGSNEGKLLTLPVSGADLTQTMDEPFFTVIIPTYRRPLLLEEALHSVEAQTVRPAQVIVVDDAEDAAAQSVVERFPWVEYVVNTNAKGGSGARNA